jgi:hypothetical protein
MLSQTSFSILLGAAPHLDGQYTVFGHVTKGLDTLAKLETLETRKEGIFVMPLSRITILSSYVYEVDDGISIGAGTGAGSGGGSGTNSLDCEVQISQARRQCDGQIESVQLQLQEKDREIERLRKKCLP